MTNTKLFVLKNELGKDFRNYLEMIDGITTIGDDVGNFAIELLNSLQKEYKEMKGFHDFKRKLDCNIKLLGDIRDNPALKDKYGVIYNQALVLLISAFELFLSNLLKRLIDEVPEKVSWKEKKKIGVDLNLLKYYSTTGDLIVKSLGGDPNFQDFQSTLRFLKDCLEINLTEKLKKQGQEMVILYQAIRHIIIHNSANIDAGFLKQIRNTKFLEKYEKLKGKKIAFDKKRYEQARRLFIKIVDSILEEII